MALQALTADGVFIIPDAYASYKVQTNPAGLATSGVLILLGESDQGPDYSQEDDLSDNFFGPDEIARFEAKYGQGSLLDGARIAVQAANDPDIVGSIAGIYPIKVNASVKATAGLVRNGLDNYGTLADKNYGTPGNSIAFVITESQSEVAPSKTFMYAPLTQNATSVTWGMRVNGGAAQTVTFASLTSPASFVGAVTAGSNTGLQALTGILATGGVDQDVLANFTGSPTDELAVEAVDNTITITFSGAPTAWDTTPLPGQLLIIPLNGQFGASADSCIAGGSNQNAGIYVVDSATATEIVATKIRNYNNNTTITAPVDVSSTALATGHTDILVYSQVTVQNITGTSRAILDSDNVGVNLSGTASGSSLVLTLASGAWAVTPAVNDLIKIPSTAPAGFHASGANGGWYRVTAATSSTITMTRLSNGEPDDISTTAIAATSDLVCIRPAIDGIGKTVEFWDANAGGTDVAVTTILRTSAGAAVDWLSTSASPQVVVSASEQIDQITDTRQTDNTSEDLVAGGDVLLRIGYKGTTATVTVTATNLTTSVTGGTGANLNVTLKNYKTVADLASFINSQTGYTASAGNNQLGQQKLFVDGVLVLDLVTSATCGSQYGTPTCRIKADAYDFWQTLNQQSLLVQLGEDNEKADLGLPEAQATTFLTGGARGATTDADIAAAVLACERLRANFVIPTFSRDATVDIADGVTDSASTYTIAAIHAAVKTHVLKMSTVKAGRNRQGFLAIDGTFDECKDAAATAATFRCSMAFQNFKAQGSDGSIQTFPSWASAVDAAGMQAAAFYQSILNKGINTSGIVSSDSTFDANSDTQLEQALLAGLLPARKRSVGGGYYWTSDQTTYGLDSNFVFNSISTIYNADLVTLTTKQRMARGLVGKSLADVSAASAASLFAGIMNDLRALKLISPSSDAPAGYKNATFRIQGNTLYVSAEVKVTNSIAFVLINFTVSEITQTASI